MKIFEMGRALLISWMVIGRRNLDAAILTNNMPMPFELLGRVKSARPSLELSV